MTLRTEAMVILQKESNLKEIVQLVGPDALPERERLTLEVARMLREDFLQQNAFHDVDTYCSMKKQYNMLNVILTFNEKAAMSLGKGASVVEISNLSVLEDIAKMKYVKEEDFESDVSRINKKIDEELNSIIA